MSAFPINHPAVAITSIAYYVNLVDQISLGFPSLEEYSITINKL